MHAGEEDHTEPLKTREWKTQDWKTRDRNVYVLVARRNIINEVRGCRANINKVPRLF